MTGKQAFLDAIKAQAAKLNVPYPALAAVVWVESNGIWQTIIEGRSEPLIRFEGHYFDRLLNAEKRILGRKQGLAHPKAGVIKNPKKQAERWKLLRQAQMIDRAAALESTSWGIGQVMGANWKMLAYPSVESLVLDARTGPAGQLRLMSRFIKRHGLDRHLNELNFQGFARRYNGPAFARYNYDKRMKKAYMDFASISQTAQNNLIAPLEERNWLILGDRGDRVRELQHCLNQAGYTTLVDGDFGPATQRALLAFQKDQGLESDGKAGPLTFKALMFHGDPWHKKNLQSDRSVVALPRWLGYPSILWNRISKPLRP